MENRQLDHSHHRHQVEKYPVCFLAHDMEVPMNVGSLFRIADALGIEKIYLSGSSPSPPNGKIKKTSCSTEKYVPFSYENNPLDLIERLKYEGYEIISLEITSSSMDIRDLVFSGNEKVCLILGAENLGVCRALLDASDKIVHIPMVGVNSSMNVATACAIATFGIVKRFLS